jgi:multidrug efflux system membrane fusion protein
MFARSRMAVGKPRAVLEVPVEAVRITREGARYVLVVGEGNIAQRRVVTPGWIENGMQVIEEGLHANDWVVVGDLGGVHPGDMVEPRKKALLERSDPASDRERKR